MSDPVASKPESTPDRTAGRLVPRQGSLHAPAAGPGQATLVWLLLKALCRRGRQAILLGLLAAASLGAAVWFLLPPPLPGAMAKLYIPLVPQTVLDSKHPDRPLERSTQAALIKSRLVIAAALRDEEVARLSLVADQTKAGRDPVDWLVSTIRVDYSESPEIMRISLYCEDATQAKVLVDAVKDSYLKEVVNNSVTERNERIKRLNDLAEQREKYLTAKRELARKLGGHDDTFDSENMQHRLNFAREQLAMTQAELLRTTSDLRRLRLEESAWKARKGGKIELPAAVLDNYVDNDIEVLKSAKRQDDLAKRVQDYRTKMPKWETSEYYLKAKAELDKWANEHKQLLAKVRREYQDEAQKKSSTDVAVRLATLQADISFSIQFEKDLQSEVNNLRALIKDLAGKNYDLDPIRLDIKHGEEMLTRIKQQAMALTIEKDAQHRVRELEKAQMIPIDADKRKLLFTALAAVVALVGVGAAVSYLEIRLRRVDSADAVVHALGLPIVGMIPRAPTRAGRFIGGAAWQAALTESINCTRTVLLHGEGLSALRVIQITSPVSGEGKTTLSTHLALSLALAGRRTLFVDGDLRNPNAHRLFGLPDGAGLCEVLRGEAAVADTVQPTNVAGLSMIPAGRWTDGTQRALAAGGLDDIFAQLREQFDVIVLDSSPVLPVTDPLLFARHADGVIVSLMMGVSRMPLADEAYQRLSVLGVRVLGAVLTGTHQRSYGYGYTYASPVTA